MQKLGLEERAGVIAQYVLVAVLMLGWAGFGRVLFEIDWATAIATCLASACDGCASCSVFGFMVYTVIGFGLVCVAPCDEVEGAWRLGRACLVDLFIRGFRDQVP